MTKAIKAWWDEVAEFYQKDSKIPVSIHYGPGSPGESYFKLMGKLKGKKVLEIGCGGAQCGIAMAKQGAVVTGMDISEGQLKFASRLAEKNRVDIKLIRGDIKDLRQVRSNSQDIVFSAWTMHYVEDMPKCFREVRRVLKKGGIFVLATAHPFYRIVDEKTLRVGRSYFDVGKRVNQDIWGNGTKHYFVRYYYTVSQVINALVDSGLLIEKMIEPDSRKRSRDDPWYGKWQYRPKLLNKIPATVILKARK
jgi:ubiquinone/menaquinone biosynthesis C-methylase UbiE